MATFSERLIKLRKEKKFSQQELADQVGYSKSTIVSWETGRRNPDILAIITLAKFFDVNVEYLKGNDNSRIAGETSYKAVWDGSDMYEQIMESLKKLDMDDCFVVYDLIQNLLRKQGEPEIEKLEKTYMILKKDKD